MLSQRFKILSSLTGVWIEITSTVPFFSSQMIHFRKLWGSYVKILKQICKDTENLPLAQGLFSMHINIPLIVLSCRIHSLKYQRSTKSQAELEVFLLRLKFKPQLKFSWFHLKLYLIFQDLSRRSIQTSFWQI